MFKFKFLKVKQQKEIHQLFDCISPPFPYVDKNDDKGENHYTLTLMHKAEKQVVGGAYLIQRDLESLQEEIQCLLPTRSQSHAYVWECSAIYFSNPGCLHLNTSFQDQFHRHFYYWLYKALVVFGKQKRIGFMSVKLSPEAYSPTKEFGAWPYIIQLLPSTCPDGLFYGILPLRGCFYESYQKQWREHEENP